MGESREERKEKLINSLVESVRGRVADNEVSDVEEWIRQYYHLVAPSDIVYIDPATLLGGALSLWQWGANRKAGEASVRIYNPRLDEEGWELNHTIVEIANDDMPFIVDSVMAELGQIEQNVHVVIHPVIRVYRDSEGRRMGVVREGTPVPDGATELQESYCHIEIDQETTSADLETIRQGIGRVLNDVRLAVRDWKKMNANAVALKVKTIPVAWTQRCCLHSRSPRLPSRFVIRWSQIR